MTGWDWAEADRARLAEFLHARGITSGPVSTRAIGDGHSNLTFLVTDQSGAQVVVRRPPPPPTPPGAHDMLREARLIGALGSTPVPVAPFRAAAAAGDVLDVDLYVMDFVAGPIVTTECPPLLADDATRRRIGESLVDTLADLHAVDWRAVGLADLGRPEGFNLRHHARMRRLVADGDGAVPQPFAALDRWLVHNAPVESGAAIVHNDFRIGNVVLSADRPGEIAAVLDWELATLGDPLFDLGYFLATVPSQEPLNPTQELGLAMLEPGFGTRDELAARYAARTGADLADLQWYTTLALWKLAVLYEYGRRRAVGGTGDPYYADERLVGSFLADARRCAGLPDFDLDDDQESA